MSAVNSWKSLRRESLLVFSRSNVQWKFLRSLGKTIKFETVASFPRELSYADRNILTGCQQLLHIPKTARDDRNELERKASGGTKSRLIVSPEGVCQCLLESVHQTRDRAV